MGKRGKDILNKDRQTDIFLGLCHGQLSNQEGRQKWVKRGHEG